jgi:hypothetical protein
MYPLARLVPALYAALSGLAVAEVPVPVYEHSVPADTRFYVLLSDSAILASGGRPSCRSWRCEVVIDVVTRFPNEKNISSAMANEVIEQVLLRLDTVALALPEPWQCMPGQVHDAGPTPGLPAELGPNVARRLRLQWEVYLHESPAQPTPPPAATRSPAFLNALRGYFQGLFTP